MRQIRYQEIADELRRRVRSASAGSVLPSESELSTEFAASRVTVRRALETIRDEGLIAARQGFGWFVATEPVRQRLETLGTIEAQLEESGKHAERKVAGVRVRRRRHPTSATCSTPTRCCASKRVNLADGEPFAVVTVWCPAALGRRLSRDDVERKPFYELLDVELRGATQTIGADSAEPPDAALLGVQVGTPVLRCRRVTTDLTGRPILVSEHLFPAHRTEFVVDIPLAEPSISPTGLRLVD